MTTMFEHGDEEETYNGLVDWLRKRREEQRQPIAKEAIDALLDEARDDGVEGYLPWQR